MAESSRAPGPRPLTSELCLWVLPGVANHLEADEQLYVARRSPVLFVPTHCVRALRLEVVQSFAGVSFAVRSSARQACWPVPAATDPGAAALSLMRTSPAARQRTRRP